MVDEGLVSTTQLNEVLRAQQHMGGRTVELLIARGYLEQKEYLNFLSKQPGVASINLLNYTIPWDVVGLIPLEIALELEIFPIDKMGKELTVGMACPLDATAIATLEEITGLRVRPLLVALSDIRIAIERYYDYTHRDNVFSLDHMVNSGRILTRNTENTNTTTVQQPIDSDDSTYNGEYAPGGVEL